MIKRVLTERRYAEEEFKAKLSIPGEEVITFLDREEPHGYIVVRTDIPTS